LLNQEFWADLTIPNKSGFWRNFAMTSPDAMTSPESTVMAVGNLLSFGYSYDLFRHTV
jgi:hypothetical protein